MTALYSVGIDLGTTNSVVAYTRLDAELAPGEQPELALLPIPQLVGPNQVESRFSLPSFLYLPREGEVGSLELPGVDDPSSGIAGIYARSQAADNRGRGQELALPQPRRSHRSGVAMAIATGSAKGFRRRLHAAVSDALGRRLAGESPRSAAWGAACRAHGPSVL